MPLVASKCGDCHHKGGFSSLDFTSIENIRANAKTMAYAIKTDFMPPWKADKKYACFINDRRLKPDEKEAILNWLKSGCKTDSVPYRKELLQTPSIDMLPVPDMIVRLAEKHIIKDNNEDEFVSYVEGLNLPGIKYLSAIAIRPGNRLLTHHVRVELDSTDRYSLLAGKKGYIREGEIPDNWSPTIPGVGFYVPGINYIKIPEGLGIKIVQGMKMIINLHYAPSTKVDYDQTEVWLYFAKDTNNLRPAFATAITMQNKNEYLPPDSIKTITMVTDPLPADISLISIEPHMHLLGKSMKVEVRFPDDSILDLISISDWDFNWQEFYYYRSYVKIPRGSRFVITSVFDNTTANPQNPFFPPQKVTFAEMNTKNEMMGFLMQYTYYRKDDENKDLTNSFKKVSQ